MKFNHNFSLNKKDLAKGLKFPTEMSSELAEIIGIHFGDGHMVNRYNYTYAINYACNISEREYAEYISKLFRQLFNVSLTITEYPKKNYIELRIYSKSLCDFFHENLLIPFGAKKDLRIPSFLYDNKSYLISFIRGVFDTDGCIIFKKYNKYRNLILKITTSLIDFAEDIKLGLLLLGINSNIYSKRAKYSNLGYDVVLNGKNSCKFFQVIGSNNRKNIEKWGCWDFRIPRK